ncbi:ABC transporter permease [Spiroplasma gladiatoris]|uniref:ABC transporter permease n=1 Tax=Spiroplasma gladiatoris TaxID=2143 RepID=A0A4P7AHS8_9MOLU|nr:ABC transporter permease [Spiroplasma gladiatoris]QBQ08005.1 ABC transporter permease [Spiroplasma gladiatoris]
MKKNLNNISLFSLIKFSFKILFFEKTFLIFILLANFFSLAVSIVFSLVSSGQMMNQLFDFYVIIFVNVFIFLLIIRILSFFFVRKLDDKTIFITLSNHISRSKFFWAEYITIMITILISVFFAFIIFNVMYFFVNGFEITSFVLKKTSIFLAYSILAIVSLTNFIIFLILFLGSQPMLIISTLLMSLSFIANIPAKLIWTSNETTKITPTNNMITNVKDMYEAFDLQKNTNNGTIKYKYLSKAINNYLTDYSGTHSSITKYLSDTSTDSKMFAELYNNFWKSELDVIDENLDSQVITYTGNIFKAPKAANNKNKWSQVQATANIHLQSKFKSKEKIQEMIDSESIDNDKKLILNDFLNLCTELEEKLINMKKQQATVFENYLYLSSDNNYKSTVTAIIESKEEVVELTKEDVVSMYRYAVDDSYSPPTSNETLTFSRDQDKIDGKLTAMIDSNFYQPMLYTARILEKYFSKYTAIFYSATELGLQNDSELLKFQKVSNTLKVINPINPFYGTWSFYTKYSGFYNDDIWFEPYNDSYINSKKQENMFLPYVLYSLDMDSSNKVAKDTYNKYFDPSYFISLILFIGVVLMFLSIYRFRKLDIS